MAIATTAGGAGPSLEVAGVRVDYRVQGRRVRVVRGVSFSLPAGSALGIVGESGSGKSTLALAVAGLLRPEEAQVDADRLDFGGRDLRHMSEVRREQTLGRRIGFVFQNPHTALNPILTIGHQLTDHVRFHLRLTRQEAQERAAKLLAEVGIADIGGRMNAYPHEFSGGMLQRVTIAIALACDPELLIADEPTTALDASVQADIVDLVAGLRSSRNLSLMWITHDLALLRHIVDGVAVMYAGQIVEIGSIETVYRAPLHPYTRALLASIRSLWEEESGSFQAIAGQPPTPASVGDGCPFRPRCPLATERCLQVPPLVPAGGEGRSVACWAVPGAEAYHAPS
jgi:oligopeptide/dipeptide ABC transporter ATP-binding protein